MKTGMIPVTLRLSRQTRTLNIRGVLTGHRMVIAPTKLHGSPNKWFEDLKTALVGLGFTVETVVEAGESVTQKGADVP